MQFLILNVDKLIGKDIPFAIIIELIATNLAYMIVLAAPMAVLFACLMAFGKFSEQNELTALKASGINPIKIIKPVVISAFILSLFLVWFSNNILPEANSKARSLFMDIRIKKPGFELKPNVFYDGIDGYIFLVREIDTETDSLFDITLFQEPTKNKKRAYIRAEQGFLKSEGIQGLTLILKHGEILRYLERNRRNKQENQERTSFSKYRLTFDLSDLEFTKSDPTGRSNSDRTMSAQAMSIVVDTLSKEIKSYLNRSSQNTSFNYIYETTNRKPFLSKYDLNFNPNTIVISDIELDTKNVISDYFTLQLITKNAHQKRIIDLANNNIHQDKSYFDNISSNILWRVKRISRYLVEIHKKFSLPLACIVFVLIGAPIGMMTRNGNFGYAALISAIILTIYWISIIQGEKLADRLFISPFTGMWAFNIIFSCIGILLILQLTTGIHFKNLFPKRAKIF